VDVSLGKAKAIADKAERPCQPDIVEVGTMVAAEAADKHLELHVAEVVCLE
jgi:hypothetical protein